MRSRTTANEQVAEVARRRLELLSAELAGVRRDGPDRPLDGGAPEASADPGEPLPQPGPGPAPGPLQPPRPGRHALRSVGAPGSVGGWVHDRLPPTLQGRVQVGASHLTVVALLVAVALAATSWFVLRADGSATVVRTSPHPSPGGDRPSALVQVATTGTPAAAGTPSASPSTVIVVDVAGKVRRPGIVTLPLGSRVVDAIESAGGVRPGVDLRSLNLARLLADGEQILVGVPAAQGVAAPAASVPGASPSTAMVNVNTADQTELETLPGIGPVTAAAILKWRTDNGPFTSVDQLLDVSGIGDVTLAEIAPLVTI